MSTIHVCSHFSGGTDKQLKNTYLLFCVWSCLHSLKLLDYVAVDQIK